MGLPHSTKTGNTSNDPLLDESGLTITLTHIMTGGKYLKWRNLGIVRLMRKSQKALPTFCLMVSKKNSLLMFPFFETADGELAKRIETAIDTATIHWAHLGAKKDL